MRIEQRADKHRVIRNHLLISDSKNIARSFTIWTFYIEYPADEEITTACRRYNVWLMLYTTRASRFISIYNLYKSRRDYIAASDR